MLLKKLFVAIKINTCYFLVKNKNTSPEINITRKCNLRSLKPNVNNWMLSMPDLLNAVRDIFFISGFVAS